jgi:hypothetical protein
MFINNSAGAGGAVYGCCEGGGGFWNCTFYGNSAPLGSALYFPMQVLNPMTLANSIIAAGNGGASIACVGDLNMSVACTNIFGNEGGDWVECLASDLGVNGNISADPLFCDPAGSGVEGFALTPQSPCAPEHSSGCGLIGALPVGCGPTSITEYSAPPSHFRLTVRPNPVFHGATFSFDPASQPLSLEIYGPAGRLVERLRPSGAVMWVPSEQAPRGVYFARLTGEGGSETVKFVVLQ